MSLNGAADGATSADLTFTGVNEVINQKSNKKLERFYAYSIMERARLAALMGDKMLSMPFICFVGQEAWRAKEAKASASEHPEWGPQAQRGPVWEATTGVSVLLCGADILIMRHPKAVEIVKKTIERLMKKG